MNSSHRAIISWIPAESGGRKSIPPGPTYSTLARFEGDDNWPHEAWSLVLEFERQFLNPRIVLVAVRFLVPEGPNHLLQSGSRFELMEGHKRVAKGIVLPATIEVPAEVNEFESALIG